MPPPEATVEHYAAQQRQAEAAVILTRRQWSLMSPTLDEWPRIVNTVTAIVAAAQLGAARAGAAYVPLALAEAGYEGPADIVRPEAWSGVASDGRPLDSLLYSAVVHVKQSMARGAPAPVALRDGGAWLGALTRTQVADAARGAAGAAVAVRDGVGWTRMVNPPCCQRCAVLAGKFFRWKEGFLRHPTCDCRHSPVTEDGFDGYTSNVAPDQIRDLTVAQRKAMNDGADVNQVVNAHRAGRRSSDGMTTSEGTRFGTARRRTRLTPEAIYRVSATRQEAVALLRRNGYVG